MTILIVFMFILTCTNFFLLFNLRGRLDALAEIVLDRSRELRTLRLSLNSLKSPAPVKKKGMPKWTTLWLRNHP